MSSRVSSVLVVLVVVPHEDRYLVVEERDGSFYLPAGRVEPGEDLATAAVRETLEEAGVDVVLRGLLGFDHTYLGEVCRLRYRFVADPAGGLRAVPKRVHDEHSRGAHWLTRAELGTRPLRDPEVDTWFDKYERRESAGSAVGSGLLPLSAYEWLGHR